MPAARLVRVAKDEVAVGTLVPVLQGFHKPVVGIGLEVQGDGAGGVLAREDARESSGFIAGHESCTGSQAQEESLQAFTTRCSYRLRQGGVISSGVRQVSEGNEAPAMEKQQSSGDMTSITAQFCGKVSQCDYCSAEQRVSWVHTLLQQLLVSIHFQESRAWLGKQRPSLGPNPPGKSTLNIEPIHRNFNEPQEFTAAAQAGDSFAVHSKEHTKGSKRILPSV